MAQRKRARRARRDPLDALRDEIRRFIALRDWKQFHSPKNLSMGLMIESAELAEHFLWASTGENLSKVTLSEVADEMGDVFIYLLNLADGLGIDVVEAARKKLRKTRLKYPARMVRGKALKYDKYKR